jgi:hypothetical protein
MAKDYRPRAEFADSVDSLVHWAARAFSVMLLMMGLGFAGVYADAKLETSYWTPIGFIVGMALTVLGLIVILQASEKVKRQRRQAKKAGGLTEENQDAGENNHLESSSKTSSKAVSDQE